MRGFSNLLLAVTSTGSDQEDRLRKSGQLECNSSSYCLSHCLAHSLTHSLTHTHIHTHTHTHTSTHTHLYTHTLTHRQTHTPLHTHIHTHTHTQTDRHTHTLPSLSPKHNSSTVIHATSKALPAHFLFTEHSRHSHGAKALSVHVAIQSRLDGHTLNQQQAPLFLCSSAYSTRL